MGFLELQRQCGVSHEVRLGAQGASCAAPGKSGLHALGEGVHCRWILYQLSYQGTLAAAAARLLQSCPTLCDPIDSSPPGPTIPGILQARTLEWVAISSSNA